MDNSYYMRLLESRSKRLGELLEMSAPIDIICQEVKLLVEAIKPLDLKFRSWALKENINEKYQPERYQFTG